MERGAIAERGSDHSPWTMLAKTGLGWPVQYIDPSGILFSGTVWKTAVCFNLVFVAVSYLCIDRNGLCSIADCASERLVELLSTVEALQNQPPFFRYQVPFHDD
jgi:hypothetical protein